MNSPEVNCLRRFALSGASFGLGLCFCLATLLLLIAVAGCAAPKAAVEQRIVAGQSIVIVQLQGHSSALTGGHLSVINLDTKQFQTWPVREGGWVGASVIPGRYLIVNHERETYASEGFSSTMTRLRLEVRCELLVPRPDVSMFFGVIDLSGSPATIIRGRKEDAQEFYSRFILDSGRPLIEGELKREQLGELNERN